MPTVTKALRDVELVSVGKHGGSVIGPDGKARAATTEVTRADLEAMLAAASDLKADAAPVKLGHDSSLNDPLGDGAPAYGWVRPTRIARNAAGRDTLYGDLVGMPSKLAEVAPAAFRRRSAEIAWGAQVGGKPYKAVLLALSLLGVAAPAVKGLADVLALYTAPELAEDHVSTVELGLDAEAVALLASLRIPGVDTDTLTRLEARLAARDTATIPAPTDDDAETPPNTPETPTTEATTMPKTYDEDKLRELLSLEAGADVDAALERLKATPAPGADATGGSGAAATTAEPASPALQATAPSAAAAPDAQPHPELATLSAGTLAELQRDAAYARQLRRTSVLDRAQTEGRITPAERTAFATALERDEEGTTILLSSMAPRFATTELGAADAATDVSDEAHKAFVESLGL